MSEEPAESEASELLRAIGAVRMPDPRVLAAAREVLWSAIASEMLGVPPERPAAARRRRAGRPPGQRKRSMGGGDADS